jgi:hypothetical protein
MYRRSAKASTESVYVFLGTPCSLQDGATTSQLGEQPSPPRRNYRPCLYQKIATATSATVMIHRIMSLLRLFSSAMRAVQHT